MQEVHTLSQRDRWLRPAQHREPGDAHTLHQGRRGRVTRARPPGRRAELEPAHAPVDLFDQVVPVGVPHERHPFGDLVVEHERHLVCIESCREPDARTVSLAVQVGGDEELLVGERVVVGQPSGGARPELELAGSAAACEPFGVGVEEGHAGAVGVDEVGVEVDAETAGEIRSPVADLLDGSPVGLVVAATPGEQPEPEPEIARPVVGAPSQHVALVDQYRQGAAEGRTFADEHASETGMDRQAQHPASDVGDVAVGVEGVELLEQVSGGSHRLLRWCGRPCELAGRRAPCSQLEQQAGQFDLRDLGRPVARACPVLDLAPQSVARARLDAPGAARPLLGRRTARRHGGEPGHARASVEAGLTCQSGVHHHADALDRERGLGDVGCEHDATAPGRRGCQRLVLLFECQRTREWEDVDVRRCRTGEQPLRPVDLADAGQEHEHVTVLLAERTEHRRRSGVLDAFTRLARHPADVHREHPALALHERGVGQHGGQGIDVGCRRHREHPQVGAEVSARVECERQAEIGRQIAFVDLVEDHQSDAGQFRVGLEPARQDALGDHLDARRRANPAFVAGLVSDGVTDLLAEDVRHPTRRRPGGQPPRFEHHDATAPEPGLVEECEGCERRLARAWGRHEHGGALVREGAAEVGKCLGDR